MNKWLLVAILVVLGTGCHKILRLDDYSEDTEATNDKDYDTEVDPHRDYWKERDCPLVADADGAVEGVMVSTDCGDVDGTGCCDGSIVWYCYQANLYCLPCGATTQEFCSWDSSEGYYNCTETDLGEAQFGPPRECPRPDPDGEHNSEPEPAFVKFCNLTHGNVSFEIDGNGDAFEVGPGNCTLCEPFDPGPSISIRANWSPALDSIGETPKSFEENSIDVHPGEFLGVWLSGMIGNLDLQWTMLESEADCASWDGPL